NHGPYLLKGIEGPLEVCEVGEVGIAPLQAPAESERAHRRDLESPRPPGVEAGGSPDAVLRQSLASTMGSSSSAASRPAPVKTVMAELVPDGEVLLNFAPVDDQPLLEGRNGWVSQLY